MTYNKYSKEHHNKNKNNIKLIHLIHKHIAIIAQLIKSHTSYYKNKFKNINKIKSKNKHKTEKKNRKRRTIDKINQISNFNKNKNNNKYSK